MTKFESLIRLALNLIFLAIGFVVALVIILLLSKLLLSGFDALPWSGYIYTAFLLMFLPLIYFGAYYYLIKRSRRHRNTFVKYFSIIVFFIAAAACIIVFGRDVYYMFRDKKLDIDHYWTFSLLFLIPNFVCLFLVAILQALTVPAEKDWLEKHRN